MINKDKIIKIDIYRENNEHLLSTKAFTFPKDFFKIRGREMVSVKQANLPLLHKGDEIYAIFEYMNGTRVKCETTVDISTDTQLNFHVDDGYVLEERRNSFKVNTPNEVAFVKKTVHEDESEELFEEPLKIQIINLNLTGIFMKSEKEFIPGDIVLLDLFDHTVEMNTKILREQKNAEGELLGYGCMFLDITPSIEEKIARYIFNLQLAERERRNKN